MNKITITKQEYLKLEKQANAYRKLVSRLFESVIKDPIQEVVDDFRRTNLYTNEFLKDLDKGLRQSSYGK